MKTSHASLVVRLCSRQSCARAFCGASLQRSHCVSTALRCALSRLHRGTHCVRFALAVRTTAMKVLTKRAARAAVKAVLLGAAEAHRSPPEHSFAEVSWWSFGPKTKALHLRTQVSRVDASPKTKTMDSRGSASECYVGPTTQSLHSRESVLGGGDFCGGEEHRAGVGARSALRKHSHRGCPSVESEANAASSAMRPWCEHRSGGYTKCDLYSMSPRWVPTAATRAPPQEAIARPLAVQQGFSCTDFAGTGAEQLT